MNWVMVDVAISRHLSINGFGQVCGCEVLSCWAEIYITMITMMARIHVYGAKQSNWCERAKHTCD
jgi:hypothetical protein